MTTATDHGGVPARPIPADSKSQRAYSLIHERILSGSYAPGDRIVLGHIGQEIGASVVPVREAIRRLEAEGMVTFERNIGARVAEIDEHEYLETMQTLSIVEGAAVASAAPFLAPEDLAQARGVNDRLRTLLEDFDPVEFTALNERFHRTLSNPCPNSHLGDLVDRGWKRLGRLRRSTFRYVPERARASVEEHAKILRLIGDGAEPLEIEMAVRAHRLATPLAFAQRTEHALDSFLAIGSSWAPHARLSTGASPAVDAATAIDVAVPSDPVRIRTGSGQSRAPSAPSAAPHALRTEGES